MSDRNDAKRTPSVPNEYTTKPGVGKLCLWLPLAGESLDPTGPCLRTGSGCEESNAGVIDKREKS